MEVCLTCEKNAWTQEGAIGGEEGRMRHRRVSRWSVDELGGGIDSTFIDGPVGRTSR